MSGTTFRSDIGAIVCLAMGNWQWLLDLVVAVLLAATLLRARRLEHALAALRRDRGEFASLLGGVEGSTHQAREAIDRLRDLAEGAGRRVEQQSATAMALQDELVTLIGRGERLAERLDHAARMPRPGAGSVVALPAASAFAKSSGSASSVAAVLGGADGPARAGIVGGGEAAMQRVRSKAERDLLLALQTGR